MLVNAHFEGKPILYWFESYVRNVLDGLQTKQLVMLPPLLVVGLILLVLVNSLCEHSIESFLLSNTLRNSSLASLYP